MENRRGSGSTVTKVFNRELSEGFFYFFYFDGITATKQDRNGTFLLWVLKYYVRLVENMRRFSRSLLVTEPSRALQPT